VRSAGHPRAIATVAVMTTNSIRTAGRQAYKIGNAQFVYGNDHLQAFFAELGLDPARGYFVLRASALGDAPSEVVGSAFGFFPRAMVAKIVERSRAAHAPHRVLAVAVPHLAAVAHSVFGDGGEIAELADRFGAAAQAAPLEARTMATAWSSVEWPEGAAAQLLRHATVLREHRGDSHLMAIASLGLSPIHAILINAGRRGDAPAQSAKSRGYRSDDIDPAVAALVDRGALTADGELSDIGLSLWEDIEAATDRANAGAWAALGNGLESTITLAKDVVAAANWG